jgi:2-polyprenyl-3-methyl-5-hydroxy-6-metoxy-1,4-benzoquinol methylase
MFFDLAIDGFQRGLGERALAEAGAPFDPDDRERFRAGVERVWAGYQAARLSAAPRRPVPWLQHRIDRAVYRRDRGEHIDDPTLPDARRTALVNDLDRLNRGLGFYHWAFRALEGVVDGAPDGELSVLDIGSGHGAFPIRLAAEGRLGTHRLRVVGSDIEPAYVAAGVRAARARGVMVEFRRVDALALDTLAERFDVITCTQTVHHFPPAMLADLMVRARRNARHGVLFFDARRGAVTLAGVTLAALAISRDRFFLDDGTVSVRRMYSPAELDLLARCAPGGGVFRARNFGPQYVVAKACVR